MTVGQNPTPSKVRFCAVAEMLIGSKMGNFEKVIYLVIYTTTRLYRDSFMHNTHKLRANE
jgi:hypothetical protein